MQAVILSAGESSRFWPLNARHKSLIKICGKPIIQYTIESLLSLKIKNIIIVQNKRRDVEEELKKTSLARYIENSTIKFVMQDEQLGMGNALLCAKDFIKEDSFFVFNPDRIDSKDFIPEMIKKSKKAKLVIAGSFTEKPWLYGIMRLDGDRIINIVEKPKESDSNIKAIGIYLLPFEFFEEYEKVRKHHYDFEETLQRLIEKYDARAVIKSYETISLKYPWDLFLYARAILDSKDFENKIKKESIDKREKKSEFKNIHIEGKVFLGSNVKIYENATIRGPCYIGNNCIIGNNALIREYSVIEDNCIIGANSEITRSILQENVSLHSGFIGDSIIGRNTSIGAGIITANKRLDREEIKAVVKGEKIATGLKSFGAVIGENVKIAIRTSIMPGTIIGNNAIIGPCSLVKGVINDDEIFNL